MNYDALSDEELVARMVTRDRLALDAIYNRYATLVFSLSVRILSEGMAAEEVTQDAFLSLWRRADHYSVERGRLLSWLLTIARSRALDSLRREDEADAHPEPETLAGAEVAQEGDPQDLLAASQRNRALHAALETLDALPRQLLALAFFRGLTHEEIAAQTALPLGTVKSRVRLALNRLRNLLDSEI